MTTFGKVVKSLKKGALEVKRRIRTSASAQVAALAPGPVDAEATIADDAIPVVTVSATGEGQHTRWVSSSDTETAASASTSSVTLIEEAKAKDKNEKLALEEDAPKERLVIRIPVSRFLDAQANSAIFYKGPDADGTPMLITTSATGEGVHTRWNCLNPPSPSPSREKLTITLPAKSKKRASPASSEEEEVFVRRTRAKHGHSASSGPGPAIVLPPATASPEGSLIYSGPNEQGHPVVVSTSGTGVGTHTRWLYPAVFTPPPSDDANGLSGEEADDEGAGSEVSSGVKNNFKEGGLKIVIPALKLKRSRDEEDEEVDCPARRTRARLSGISSFTSSASFGEDSPAHHTRARARARARLSASSSSSSSASSNKVPISPTISRITKSYTRNPYAPSPPPRAHTSIRVLGTRKSLRLQIRIQG